VHVLSSDFELVKFEYAWKGGEAFDLKRASLILFQDAAKFVS
jgi:hypothetical protein